MNHIKEAIDKMGEIDRFEETKKYIRDIYMYKSPWVPEYIYKLIELAFEPDEFIAGVKVEDILKDKGQSKEVGLPK